MNSRPPYPDDLEAKEDPYTVTQASRIYFLPNLMTAGNLFCGFVAVIHCIQARLAETVPTGEYLNKSSADHYTQAVWFIFGAAAFDTLDGRLARMGGRESRVGAEFDSLADVLSFGKPTSPKADNATHLLTQGYEIFRSIGWFLGFIYLLCAAVRLARFNVITNPLLHGRKKETNKDFVGLPVPAAAATVASLVLFLLHLSSIDKSLRLWALALPPLMLLIAILMVSTVRYPSGKNLNLQTKARLQFLVGFVVLAGLVVLFKEYALVCACLGYIFYGLIRQWRRPARPKVTANSV